MFCFIDSSCAFDTFLSTFRHSRVPPPGHCAHPPAGGWGPDRQGHHHQGPDWREVGPVRRAARGHADVHFAPRGQQPEPSVAGDVRGAARKRLPVKCSPAWDECAQNPLRTSRSHSVASASLLRTQLPSPLVSKQAAVRCEATLWDYYRLLCEQEAAASEISRSTRKSSLRNIFVILPFFCCFCLQY